MKAFQEISERHQLSKSVEIQDILHMPDVMTTSEEEVDQTSIHQLVFTAVEQAVGQLLTMREKEGQELYQDLVQHLTNIQQLRDEVESLAPTVSEQYEDRLRKRLTDYLEGTIDEQRVLAEVAIFAEKADVNEELTRIHSHLTQFFQTIDTTDVIGRKLDFLVQELNREMNTIGAKANNGKIAQCVIDMKTQLERLKEQVQNIE